MPEIPLTNSSLTVLVDEADCWVAAWNWQLSESGYAYRCESRGNRKRNVWMHREINGTSKGVYTDHWNRNKLDNRRKNLRNASKTNNQANCVPYLVEDKSSSFKGVTWHKKAQKWMAQLMRDGINHYLGLYTSETEAAAAYDAEAVKHFGAFARLNV